MELPWNNSELITGDDVLGQIKKLKEMDGPDLWVWGSGKLIQTLLANDLVDRMHVWVYPVTIGAGKKLFAEGTQPRNFTITDAKVTKTGVITATYEPAGVLTTGGAPA
jgi:dihydrofolate reductase